jgi:hypothetical protein
VSPYCKPCLLFLALTGCGDEPNVAQPTLPFEAEWVSVDITGKSLYIGEKRWCVYERQPDQISIQGKLDVPPQPKVALALTVILSSAQALKDGSWQEVEEYSGNHVVLRLEGDLLRVQCPEFPESKLKGVYKYGSDDAPEKGPSIHEWGRYEYAGERH